MKNGPSRFSVSVRAPWAAPLAAAIAAVLPGCGDVAASPDSRGSSTGTVAQAIGTGSCVAHCGSSAGDCWCDNSCTSFGDCCNNYSAACGGVGGTPDAGPSSPAVGSCVGHCGSSAGSCWCDGSCSSFGDCCSNFATVCSSGPPVTPAGPPAGWTALMPGTTVGGSVTLGGQIRYAFPRVAGRTYRVVLIPGGDAPSAGDVDLYSSGESTLSLTSYTCRPYLGGASPEACSFVAPAGGWNYVIVHGFAAGSYTLSVFEQGAGPAPAAGVFDPAVNPPSGGGWYDFTPFMTGGNRHLGADMNREGGASADLGSVVFAAADGTVSYAANAGTGWNGVVILRHDAAPSASFSLPGGGTAATVWSLYGHLNLNFVSTWLQPGDVVRRGQPIGVVGPTPSGSSGPHLHFEVRTIDMGPGLGYGDIAGGRVNPITFIALN